MMGGGSASAAEKSLGGKSQSGVGWKPRTRARMSLVEHLPWPGGPAPSSMPCGLWRLVGLGCPYGVRFCPLKSPSSVFPRPVPPKHTLSLQLPLLLTLAHLHFLSLFLSPFLR